MRRHDEFMKGIPLFQSDEWERMTGARRKKQLNAIHKTNKRTASVGHTKTDR